VDSDAHFGSSHVSVLAVRPDGGVGERVDLQSPGMRAHQIVSDPTGRYVLVPCRDGNIVAQYGLDPATGKLTPNDPAAVRASPGPAPATWTFTRTVDLPMSSTSKVEP
jgi:6-phosphogluconolactonase